MSKPRIRRPSPALIIAVIALFVGLGGGAYAGGEATISKVKTSDIKNKAVTSKKLANKAVKSSKIKKGAVKTNKVADLAINNRKLSNATYWAYVQGNPAEVIRSNGATQAVRIGTGSYRVEFDTEQVADIALSDCSYQVTPSITGTGREAQVDVDPANNERASIRIRSSFGVLTDSNYSVAVFC